MTINIKRNVSTLFLSESLDNDITLFQSLAEGSLKNIGYVGMSVGNNDYSNCSFIFNSEDVSSCETALDAVLATFASSSLASLKLEIFAKINVYRDAWFADYFPYSGHRWNCDEESRFNILGMNLRAVMSGGVLPPDEIFRDYDNNNVPVTASYMALMGEAYFAFRKTCYQASWIHKYYLGLMTTAAAVEAYDYTVGWPSKDPV